MSPAVRGPASAAALMLQAATSRALLPCICLTQTPWCLANLPCCLHHLLLGQQSNSSLQDCVCLCMCGHIHCCTELPSKTYPMSCCTVQIYMPKGLEVCPGASASQRCSLIPAPRRAVRAYYPCAAPGHASGLRLSVLSVTCCPSQHTAGPYMPEVISTAGTLVCMPSCSPWLCQRPL